jgi:hypothetical protein
VSSYSGDGAIIDNGWQLKGGRYTVDLGPIDISRPSKHSYTLQRLPDAEFVIGIEIVEAMPNRDQRPNHKANVRLDLKGTDDRSIVSEHGSLEKWVWSYGLGDTKSFLYQRGEGKDIPLSSGGTRGQRTGAKASGGWGTYFKANESSQYQLTLEVLASEMPHRPARLILKSVDR